MKVYISGKISGTDLEKTQKRFADAYVWIYCYGGQPVNPFELNEISPEKTWKDYMVADIKALVECDAIYMLKRWHESKGATLEFHIAKELGIKIIFE